MKARQPGRMHREPLNPAVNTDATRARLRPRRQGRSMSMLPNLSVNIFVRWASEELSSAGKTGLLRVDEVIQ